MTSVFNIVAIYLSMAGFDGLANDELLCGCELRNLEPCGGMHSNCLAAYKHTVTRQDIEKGLFDHLDLGLAEGDWIMRPPIVTEARNDSTRGKD